MPRLFGVIAARLILLSMLVLLTACGASDSVQVEQNDSIVDSDENVSEVIDNADDEDGGEGSDNLGNEQNVLEYFVATNGSDLNNDGSETQPFLTITKAQEAIRIHSNKGELPLFVTMLDGTYYLEDTFVLTSEDSGADSALVTYRAKNEGGAIISGGKALSLSWETYSGDILKAQTPSGLVFDQLFIDGERQHMARYPNHTTEEAIYNGYAEDAYSTEKTSEWSDPTGGFLHAMHAKRWGGYSYLITGKDADNNLSLTGGGQNNRPGELHETMRMVENIFEELDAPGEWFHDESTNTLYYYPLASVDINNASVEVSQLDQLVEFQGEESKVAQFIALDGFVFQHANRTFMDTTEPLLRSDWAIHRGGAIFVNGAEDVSITNCELDQLGGNGFFINNYNRRITIEGCHIHDMGASAIAFVGDPDAVYNPLFQYSETQNIDDISWESGAKTTNYPAQSIVNDNLIHDIGIFEKQAAGVQLSMSSEITVSYTSIYNTSRAGINVSEGTFGGHIIEHVDVFNTVLETNDHGSFNSWGRDRFWRLQNASDADMKEIALLDTERSVIRNSRFRCDNGWDIDLDDGSSNYEIYNNVLLSGGLKLREGFYREAYNNIMINSGLHPHVWYDDSGDSVYHNIFMSKHQPIGMPDSDWGDYVDYNTFLSEANRDANTAYGIDANSNFGDLLFLAPSIGNYQVASDSPALELGFVNFDTLDVGVQKESLKMMREEPALPDIDGVEVIEEAPTTYWNGASAMQLVGEAFSAYGVSESIGGMVLTVPEDSLAYAAGLRTSDVIVSIQGGNVSTIAAFLSQTASAGGAALTIKFSREQVESELTMNSYYYVVSEESNTSDFNNIPLLSADDHLNISGISTTPSTSNESVTTLYDGFLAENFGAIFANTTAEGTYQIELDSVQSVSMINTFSFNKGDVRGTQNFVLQGKTSDGEWVPLHGVYQTVSESFLATKLVRSDAAEIGLFESVRWVCYAVTDAEEHTAFQEFQLQ